MRYSCLKEEASEVWPADQKGQPLCTSERHHSSPGTDCTGCPAYCTYQAHPRGVRSAQRKTDKACSPPALCSTVHKPSFRSRQDPAGTDTIPSRRPGRSTRCIPPENRRILRCRPFCLVLGLSWDTEFLLRRSSCRPDNRCHRGTSTQHCRSTLSCSTGPVKGCTSCWA